MEKVRNTRETRSASFPEYFFSVVVISSFIKFIKSYCDPARKNGRKNNTSKDIKGSSLPLLPPLSSSTPSPLSSKMYPAPFEGKFTYSRISILTSRFLPNLPKFIRRAADTRATRVERLAGYARSATGCPENRPGSREVRDSLTRPRGTLAAARMNQARPFSARRCGHGHPQLHPRARRARILSLSLSLLPSFASTFLSFSPLPLFLARPSSRRVGKTGFAPLSLRSWSA